MTAKVLPLKTIMEKVRFENKNSITIGLPKSLFYFQHEVLWKNFLKNIGCNVAVSENTNKSILDNGVKYCSNETCLPVKVFHGHVFSLKDKVDYVLIPRYLSIDKNESSCPKFCGLPDMTALNLKKQVKVLEVCVDFDQSPKVTYKSLEKLSKILRKNYKDVLDAFLKEFKDFKETRKAKTTTAGSNCSSTIAVLGHPYLIYDDYLSLNLIKKLADKKINVLTSTNIGHEIKRKNAYPFQNKYFWDGGFESLGSAFTFAEDQNINGIIYLTPFACGMDSLIIEFIERRFKSHYSTPFLKLTIDEHTGEAGFDTRIEAFLDMIG